VSDFFISQAATDQQRDLVLTRAQKLRPVVHKVRLVEEHWTTQDYGTDLSFSFSLMLNFSF
jgi:hypothetical protein